MNGIVIFCFSTKKFNLWSVWIEFSLSKKYQKPKKRSCANNLEHTSFLEQQNDVLGLSTVRIKSTYVQTFHPVMNNVNKLLYWISKISDTNYWRHRIKLLVVMTDRSRNQNRFVPSNRWDESTLNNRTTQKIKTRNLLPSKYWESFDKKKNISPNVKSNIYDNNTLLHIESERQVSTSLVEFCWDRDRASVQTWPPQTTIWCVACSTP